MLSNSASLLATVAAFAAVLALIWLADRAAQLTGLARRSAAGGHLLSVEDMIALDSRRRLHLVCCAGRQVLLLTGAGQDMVDGWIDPPPGRAGIKSGRALLVALAMLLPVAAHAQSLSIDLGATGGPAQRTDWRSSLPWSPCCRWRPVCS
jgi:flagellar protein FliO/FliZ